MKHLIKMTETTINAGIPLLICQLSSEICMDTMKIITNHILPKCSQSKNGKNDNSDVENQIILGKMRKEFQ